MSMMKKSKMSLILGGVLLALLCGLFRIYHGEPIDFFKVVLKDSFSFTDTVVNLDDIIGMPRIAVASTHPAVKRQLEKMGIIENDETVQARAATDIQNKAREYQEQAMKDYEKKLRELQER